MSQAVWSFKYDDCVYEKPILVNNKCFINNTDLVAAVEAQPALWRYMIDNMDTLETGVCEYIERISEKFEPEIPIHSYGRVKVPSTQWQAEEKHRYVRLELIHCANYSNYILPFHDEEKQYGWFFVDIDKSIKTKTMHLYWRRDQHSDGYEEHIWTNEYEIEIIYSPKVTDDAKDKVCGGKDVVIEYLKKLNNERLDEIEESCDELFKILFSRLKSKCRIGLYGRIISVQGIITSSIWDTMLYRIQAIVNDDESYSKNKNLLSYKLTRKQLFKKLQANSVFLLRFYDEDGKEMKLSRNLMSLPLFHKGNSFMREYQTLSKQISIKYKSTKREIDSLCGLNGIRINFNRSTKSIKLVSNTFATYYQSSLVDVEKSRFPIKETLGRKTGW